MKAETALITAALFLAISTALSAAPATQPLSLEAAYARVIERHPALATLQLELQALIAARDQAAQSPPLALSTDLENAFGSGDSAALRSAELTVSLASAIEATGKRQARLALAEAEMDQHAARAEVERLQLLAEVAKRYLDVLAALTAERIAGRGLDQARTVLDAISVRVDAGAESEAAQLAARADLVRVEGATLQRQQEVLNARRRLAALWGDPLAEFDLPQVRLGLPPTLPDLDQLRAALKGNPGLQAYAQREALSRAQLAVANSAKKPDIEWQLGLRRLQAEDDWALVGGLSIPLGTKARAEPVTRRAGLELEAVASAQGDHRRELEIALVERFGEMEAAHAEYRHIAQRLLPVLERAIEQAQKAYLAGVATLPEWRRLQLQRMQVEQEQLDALVRVQRALIDMQQLTGNALVVELAAAGGRP